METSCLSLSEFSPPGLEKVDFEELTKEFRNDLIEPMFGLNMTYDAKGRVLTVEITKNDDDFRTE